MKVVHIATSLNGGGAQYMLYRLLKFLNPGIESEVISLHNVGMIGELLREIGVPVTALGMARGKVDIGRIIRLKSLLKQKRPDLVHTWMYHSDLIGGIAARWAGVPRILWSLHVGDPNSGKRMTILVARASATLSRFIPDHIVSVSRKTEEAHLTFGYRCKHLSVIPGGYDFSAFRPDPDARRQMRAELGIGDETLAVGLVTRYDPVKGHRDFLRAAKVVLPSHPKAIFVMAGRGVDASNAELTGWIAELGLGNSDRLLGPSNDVPRMVNGLDLLVSASTVEAGPLIIGEALSCGVPCVGTDLGLTADLIGDTGLVTPPGNADALAAAICRMLDISDDERRALGMRGRQRIIENFGIQTMARAYEKLYEQLVTAGFARQAERSRPVNRSSSEI